MSVSISLILWDERLSVSLRLSTPFSHSWACMYGSPFATRWLARAYIWLACFGQVVCRDCCKPVCLAILCSRLVSPYSSMVDCLMSFMEYCGCVSEVGRGVPVFFILLMCWGL